VAVTAPASSAASIAPDAVWSLPTIGLDAVPALPPIGTAVGPVAPFDGFGAEADPTATGRACAHPARTRVPKQKGAPVHLSSLGPGPERRARRHAAPTDREAQ